MTQSKEWKIPENIKKIVVDGANVAYASKIGTQADIHNLINLLSFLRIFKKSRPNLDFEVVCDASLKHHISDKSRYERWIERGTVRQCPAYVTADIFIISLLQQYDGEILLISNDLFRDHASIRSLKHRVQFGFINAFDQLYLEELIFINPPRSLENKSTPQNSRINSIS